MYVYRGEALYMQSSDVVFLQLFQTDSIVDLFVQVVDYSLIYRPCVQLLVYDALVCWLDRMWLKKEVYIRSKEEDDWYASEGENR